MAVITCCAAAGALAFADGDDDIKALGAGCGCCCVIALVVMFFFTANEVASLTEASSVQTMQAEQTCRYEYQLTVLDGSSADCGEWGGSISIIDASGFGVSYMNPSCSEVDTNAFGMAGCCFDFSYDIAEGDASFTLSTTLQPGVEDSPQTVILGCDRNVESECSAYGTMCSTSVGSQLQFETSSSDSELDAMPSAAPSGDGTVPEVSECE